MELCERQGQPSWCVTHNRWWRDCKKMELNAERDSGLVLKPGMRVRIEIETTVKQGFNGKYLVAGGVVLNGDGSRKHDYDDTTTTVTLVPVTQEVRVRLTGPGLTAAEAQKLVRQFIESSAVAREYPDELTFDINRAQG